MKFRKRPAVIEAVQFDDIPAHDPPGVFRRPEDGSPYVVTIHSQRCYISPGDWIIPEPDGVHYYPCKPDIFEKTYDLAVGMHGDSRWIKSGDNPPPLDIELLCYWASDKTMLLTQGNKTHQGEVTWSIDEATAYYTYPDYWMPAPEPPND